MAYVTKQLLAAALAAGVGAALADAQCISSLFNYGLSAGAPNWTENPAYRNDSCWICVSSFSPGDDLVGTSTGSGLTASCSGADTLSSIDYWRPTVTLPTSAPNCYTITLDSGNGAFVKLFGLTQVDGTIQYGSRKVIQEGIQTATQGSTVKFFGTKSTVTAPSSGTFTSLLSIGASTNPGGSYRAKLRCMPAMIPPPPNPGGTGPQSGMLRLAPPPRTPGAVSHINYDFWVYNEQFDPIPGYGHDEPDDAGMTRFFPPGRYYIAVSDADLVNNMSSDMPDEQNRSGCVMEYPNGVLCTSAVAPIPDLNFTVSDSLGTYFFSAAKHVPFDVTWITFDVVQPGTTRPPTGVPLVTPATAANCGSDSVLLTVQAYPGRFPVSQTLHVLANLTVLGLPAPSELTDDGHNGDLFPGDGVFSLLVNIPAGTAPGHLMLPFQVRDEQNRSFSEFLHMDITEDCAGCPACAADFNSDGGVDGEDVSSFFSAWELGGTCADVNQDGGVDGDDVGFFFGLWEQGHC